MKAQTVVLSHIDKESASRAQFITLVETQNARAYSTAWRLLGGDKTAAEDVVQEAFLRAYRSRDGFREASSMSTWFFRILLRQVSNHRRKQRLRRLWSLFSEETIADPKATPPADHGLRQRIAEALAQLTVRQRSVFVLIHLEGFTVVETATILECADGTVKSHLHRALKRLRHALADLKPNDVALETR